MHRHDNAQHDLAIPPLLARPGEVRPLPQGGVFDVEAAAAEILRAPQRFEWTEIHLSLLAEQIRGLAKLNFHYVAVMERDRARRPLLLGQTDGGGRLLLDGRHRAARSLQLGYKTSGAWTLTWEQIAEFTR